MVNGGIFGFGEVIWFWRGVVKFTMYNMRGSEKQNYQIINHNSTKKSQCHQYNIQCDLHYIQLILHGRKSIIRANFSHIETGQCKIFTNAKFHLFQSFLGHTNLYIKHAGIVKQNERKREREMERGREREREGQDTSLYMSQTCLKKYCIIRRCI